MPDWAAEIRRRLAAATLAPEREAEIASEIGQHLEDRYQSLLAAGHAPADAERTAWRELEDADTLTARLRPIESAAATNLAGREAPRRTAPLAGLWQDTRYAARSLRKRPLLSLTVIATIALTLGPTTAAIGMAEALFFKPVPGVARQDRLLSVAFGTHAATGGTIVHFMSSRDAADVSAQMTTMTAMTGVQRLAGSLLVEGAAPVRADGEAVSANFFDVLGVRLAAGRSFLPSEDATPGGSPVVVLADRPAHDYFGSPAAALGRHVLLNGVDFTVIGVVPPEFESNGSAYIVGQSAPIAFWITGMTYKRAMRVPAAGWPYGVDSGPFSSYIGRMADHATLPQTMSELEARTRALASRDTQGSAVFETVKPILTPGFAAPLSVRPAATRAMALIGAVVALLVALGMANVANLLIFRGLGQARDIAIRKALGAAAARLIQLRLVESLLLAGAGAAAGVGVALLLGRVFGNFAVLSIGVIDVLIDWRVLAATVALAMAVGLGFGVAPALLAARGSATGALGRGGSRSASPRAARLRHALAAAQIALSLMLLIGAFLFLSTLRNLHAVDLGFDPARLTFVPLSLRTQGYSAARSLAFERRLVDGLRQQPGIDAASLTATPPLLQGFYVTSMYREGASKTDARSVTFTAVSADYFRTVALPIVRGRPFTEAETFGDVTSAESPVVVSETLARLLFGSIDVVGQAVRDPYSESVMRIVGVSRESHFRAVDTPPDPVAYRPLSAVELPGDTFLIVRSDLGANQMRQRIASGLAALDPTLPMAPDRTLSGVIDQRLGQQRLFAWLLAFMGAIGFVLASVGLHGLVAQSVLERRREFGIRMAIGATGRQVVRSVLRQVLLVASLGICAGLTLAWLSGRLVESRLFGVASHDPLVYLAAIGALIVVSLTATAAPARAATRVDPIEVLRGE
jgi:predicted permease